MRFNTAVIPYEGNDDWVEAALYKAKEVVQMTDCPLHSDGCEFDRFIQGANEATSQLF